MQELQNLYQSVFDTELKSHLGLGLAAASSLYLFNSYWNGGVNSHYPSLDGKVVVVTGANSGIGYICAEEFAKLGAKTVVMACRDFTRGQNAVLQVRTQHGVTNVEFMKLDLNDLDSVEAFAEEFGKKYEKLDILLNNAGVMGFPKRETTKQGFEKQIGVNHLGHFLLSTLLMDKLRASGQGRIVNLSSLAHGMGSNSLNFDDLMLEKNYNGDESYAQSKLATVYFTRHLSTILDKNVKTVSLHPGCVRTDLVRYIFEASPVFEFVTQWLLYPLLCLFTKSAWQGAQTSIYCCLCPFTELQNGLYYSDCVVKAETLNPKWKDEAKKLHEWSVKATEKYTE